MTNHDPRFDQLQQWLSQTVGNQDFQLAPASSDASFRRYFRATWPDGNTRIVMDAPPQHEDCRPFLQVAALFEAAGAHVPKRYAENLQDGFLLLSDLGTQTYLSVLNDDNADQLYAEALGALSAIQLASRPGVLPAYDHERLLREVELFPVWYIARHLGHTLSEAETESLYQMFEEILRVNLAEPPVFVHRDYHARNLMVSSPNPGVIDFQDALYGPLSYDLVSLFKDAYIQWPEERTLDWLIRYWQTARQLGLPVHADFNDFHRDYEFMGVQRHLKVLGIFARLAHRDGKHGYLQDMPLVYQHLYQTTRRYRELHPLARLLEKLDPAQKTS